MSNWAKPAELQAPVEPHVGAGGPLRGAQRLVLPVRAVRGGAAQQELLRRDVVLGGLSRVVVLGLVVVPGDDEGVRGVGGAQIGVGLVEAVPQPVVLQRDRLPVVVGGEPAVGVVAGAAGGVDGVLVEVVAEVEDDVDVLLGEVLVRGEVAVVVRLAGDGGQAQRAVAGAAGGRGAGPADGAGPRSGAEAVVEDAVGVEALDLDVDAVVELRVGGDRSAPHDAGEALVTGELPAHLHPVPGQSAAGLVRARCESRPQQDRVGKRVAGGDAEGERVVADLPRVELGGARGARGGQVDREGERGCGSGDGEETAAADLPGRVAHLLLVR